MPVRFLQELAASSHSYWRGLQRLPGAPDPRAARTPRPGSRAERSPVGAPGRVHSVDSCAHHPPRPTPCTQRQLLPAAQASWSLLTAPWE